MARKKEKKKRGESSITVDDLADRVSKVMTATLAKSVPAPSAFTYELKWDGYRIVAVKAGGEVRLVSRKGQDYTKEMATVATAIAALDVESCALDGEVCALDARGVPSFQLLQNRMRKRAPLVYFAFDCLFRDGEDLRDRPIEERRAALDAVLGTAEGALAKDRARALVRSSASEGDPKAILALACKNGLEGIVAKRKGSTYEAGRRSSSWLKVKCKLRQELAIVGYLPLKETGRAVGGLLLAVADGHGGFVYAGKVGTGFDDRTRAALAELLDRDRVERPTAKGVPRFGGIERHCRPRWVAEVELGEWTEGGHVRHPSFQGLRRDKEPSECVREEPAPETELRSAPHASGDRPVVAGVSISNASRVLTPTGMTKLALAEYYEAVAEVMLPHVEGRPLTLVRWAEGKQTEKGGVYLRHAKAWGPDVLRRVKIREKNKLGEYLVADTAAALVGLAQMDILEIHTWGSRADDVERPDRLVLDLDPAPDVAWKEVVRAALLVRERLAALGLESWVKTTGGKGLHVVVPIAPEADWDTCLAFTRAFAQWMVKEDRARFVAVVPKHHRGGKILVDYLRNNRTNTSVAAFSTRARGADDGSAPVSMPIAWDDLEGKRPITSDAFTAARVARAVTRGWRDPWAGYGQARQRLPRRARSPGP